MSYALEGHEATWSRVLVSLQDISQHAQAQDQALLQRREEYVRSLFNLSPVSLCVEDFSDVKRLMDEVRVFFQRHIGAAQTASTGRAWLHKRRSRHRCAPAQALCPRARSSESSLPG